MRCLKSLAGQALVLGALLGIAGCASKPLETADLNISGQTPAEVVAASQTTGDAGTTTSTTPDLPLTTVLWGGVVVEASNLPIGSQLEVLGYPLDKSQRPDLEADSQGRFLVITEDYLEPLDFSPGRRITVLGSVEGVSDGTVGEARYRFARIRARQLHLWQSGADADNPRFSFGIGVNLSN